MNSHTKRSNKPAFFQLSHKLSCVNKQDALASYYLVFLYILRNVIFIVCSFDLLLFNPIEICCDFFFLFLVWFIFSFVSSPISLFPSGILFSLIGMQKYPTTFVLLHWHVIKLPQKLAQSNQKWTASPFTIFHIALTLFVVHFMRCFAFSFYFLCFSRF